MNSLRIALSCGLVLLLGVCLHAARGEDRQPPPDVPTIALEPPVYQDALERWQRNILADSGNRYCDRATAEDLGWLVSPFVEGFRNGYLLTHDPAWIDRLFDWADACKKRMVVEPDQFPGWPAPAAAGTDVDHLNQYNADSLLGEAMLLRPIVLMGAEIRRDPALRAKYGQKADDYLVLAETIYEKWDTRGAWRDPDGKSTISVVLPFGIAGERKWTDSFDARNAPGQGFSHPDNKANLVAQWLLALFDATGKPVYRERATRWFTLMKSRMSVDPDGNFAIWNYWQPAGPWDYKPDGSTKHWVGVHPNAGYYVIDTSAIVDAYRHEIVFTADDIHRLIRTAIATHRPWPALAPYDKNVAEEFRQTTKPDSWAGMTQFSEFLLAVKPPPASKP